MQTSKLFKRIMLILLTGAFVVCGVLVYKNIIIGSNANVLLKNRLKQIEARGENVEMLFIGGSRIYRSFDPDYFETELGIDNAINLATPSQRPFLTYYLLKEYVEKYEPEYVVLGITNNGMTYSQSRSTALMGTNRLSLKTQLECLSGEYGKKESLLISLGKLEDFEFQKAKTIWRNVVRLVTGSDEDADTRAQLMKSNGFMGSYDACEDGGMRRRSLKLEHFDKEDVDFTYYDMMLDICREHGTQVFLVTGMCSMANIYRLDNYQDSVDMFEEYAKDNGIVYINTNYLKGRDEIFPDNMFKDRLHLNLEGGRILSEKFSKILKECIDGKDISGYFYRDLDEMDSDINRVISIFSGTEFRNGKATITVNAVHGKNYEPECRLIGRNDSGDTVLSDWVAKSEFDLSADKLKQYNVIRIEGRTSEFDKRIAFSDLTVEEIINGESD